MEQLQKNSFDFDQKIYVHCYTFAPEENGKGFFLDLIVSVPRSLKFYFFVTENIAERFDKHFGQPMPQDHSIHIVRKVAPSKLMYCISFLLPTEVLFAPVDCGEPVKKRLKQ